MPVAAAVWELEHVEGRGDPEIARIAGLQRGLVVREQLLAAGLGRGAIAHRIARRRLQELHRGVYLVGHAALAPLALETAAVLDQRGHAVLSHRTAAVIWGLVAPIAGDITLTVVGTDRRSRPGQRMFRVAELDRRDLRVRAGLPVTAPARTLLDFASGASGSELERALSEARVRRLALDHELMAAMHRAPGRTGVAALRRLLEGEAVAFSRSEAERRMTALVRASSLPSPETNVRIGGYLVDFLWSRERLVIEVDGHAFHGHRTAFERDRRRDQTLVAGGYRVIRVTWSQLKLEPFALVARIAMALSLPRP